MFNGLLTERHYWGHQHWLIQDDHPEKQRLELNGTKGINSRIMRANFSHSSFRNLDLTGSVLTNCDFAGAVLTDCNLEGTTFQNCNLRSASFRGCQMDGADFASSNLDGTDLVHSAIAEVKFNRAIGNNHSFISKTLVVPETETTWAIDVEFCATYHKVYIGCKSWSTAFFGEYHRQIISNNYYYYPLYKKYRTEILDLLVQRRWIDKPSHLTSLVNLLPVRDRRV